MGGVCSGPPLLKESGSMMREKKRSLDEIKRFKMFVCWIKTEEGEKEGHLGIALSHPGDCNGECLPHFLILTQSMQIHNGSTVFVLQAVVNKLHRCLQIRKKKSENGKRCT